jgi:ParB-like chromosome segregation protein Spo0J
MRAAWSVTGEVCPVAVAELSPGDSPRLSGVDWDNVAGLAEVEPANLPPIVVHRATMRVFDGVHRLEAAKLRGDATIAVRFVDDECAAFVEAVRNNATHGKPLTLGEKRAAAQKIIQACPEWSDRKVAEISGLSKTTVAKIRPCSTGRNGQLNVRVGRDGRRRPVRGADGRERVAALLANRPDATLRELASGAGVALGTAKDVRDRLRRREPAGPAVLRETDAVPPEPTDREILAILARDPSLIQRESGRKLVQWLAVCAIKRQSVDELIANVPAHLIGLVAQLVSAYAEKWSELAEELRGVEVSASSA